MITLTIVTMLLKCSFSRRVKICVIHRRPNGVCFADFYLHAYLLLLPEHRFPISSSPHYLRQNPRDQHE